MCTITDGAKKLSPVTVFGKMSVGRITPVDIFRFQTVCLTEKSVVVEILEKNNKLLIVGV